MPISDFDSTISRLSTVARKKGHASSISLSNPPSAPLSACPTPYHPGNITRACAQLKTQGIARKSSMRCELERDAGREPIFSSDISVSGVICLKNDAKPSVSYTRARYALNASLDRFCMAAAKRCPLSPETEAFSSEANRVAAVMDSRYVAALSQVPYLAAM